MNIVEYSFNNDKQTISATIQVHKYGKSTRDLRFFDSRKIHTLFDLDPLNTHVNNRF